MDVDLHLKSSSNQQRLAITYRRIEELKPDPANPRRHSNKQIRQIANSIRSFGFNAPIAVDRDDKVVSGHGQLLACRLLRWTEMPTLLLDRLSPAQARAFMLADNRLAELADWDDRLLVQHLKELSLLVLDFNIEDTGLRDRRDRFADCIGRGPAAGSRRSGRFAARTADRSADHQNRRFVGPRPPPPVVRQRSRRCSLRDVDGRGARRDRVHRPAVQCADRWSRDRSWRHPPWPPFQWLAGRWTQPSSPPSSPRLSGTSPHSVLMARSTLCAWTGVISRNYWLPAERPTARY